MLIRSFRLTDKLTNALLKMMIFGLQFMLERAANLRQAMVVTGAAVFLTVVGGIRGTLVGVVNTTRRIYQIVTRTVDRTTETVSQQAQTRRQMVQRAIVVRAETQAQELENKVIEDPMVARNRSLSGIVVVLLVVLIGFLVLNPNTGDTPSPLSSGSGGGGIIPAAPLSDDANPVIPTPSPIPTEGDPLLTNVDGTLIFTLRQNGQDDLWALPVGSAQPVRMTDSLSDDRDPAWSPDGGQVAFASRRDGFWNLYVIDLVAGELRQLTFSQRYVGAPTWSPDGQFIAFEAYTEDAGNIDIYIISSDGQEGPFQFTRSPLPDIEPAWSPSGRDIAYVGWREGNQDVLMLNLDGQPENEALNLTDSPDVAENAPRFNPDGSRIAYTATVDGVAGVYVKSVNNNTPAQLIGRGRFPTWNPVDGTSVFYTTEGRGTTALYLGQVDGFGVGANAVAFEGKVEHVDWTASLHSLQGFDPITPPLFIEEITERPDGKIALALLTDVNAPDPVLSDAVNDSFDAMRRTIGEKVGYDLLGSLESVFWRRERPPDPGQDRTNWHYTGRAISLDRNAVLTGDLSPIVAVREVGEVGTFWRVYARVAESAQGGGLGEPLRTLPWDFSARFGDDPVAFEQGGRPMTEVPEGYYVDLTELMADFGWNRVQSDRNWRSNYAGVLYWQFERRDGLTWQAAMEQIYTAQEVEEFLAGIISPLPTSVPSPTATIDPDLPANATPLDFEAPTAIPTATSATAVPTPSPTSQDDDDSENGQ